MTLINLPQTGRWTFESGDIAKGFDAHVREQLPWYDLTTAAVSHIARHYIPQGGLVYDIGASTGNVGRAIEGILDDRHAKLIPVESSAAMCDRYKGPFVGNLVNADALTVDFEPFDLAILFLTLMFVPVADRSKLIANLRSKVKPGGAIVIVDKARANSGYLATVLWRLTLAGKVAAGAEPGAIIAKELSLGGVQRPVDPSSELPAEAVEWFRFGEFAGWIIEA